VLPATKAEQLSPPEEPLELDDELEELEEELLELDDELEDELLEDEEPASQLCAKAQESSVPGVVVVHHLAVYAEPLCCMTSPPVA
tara:strand:+ start:1465 stop:1722 length:258 start_codon:yes stop_codon:yes gene_type:complete